MTLLTVEGKKRFKYFAQKTKYERILHDADEYPKASILYII